MEVREPPREPLEDRLVELLAGRDDRLTRTLDELLERPVVERDADDRAVEEPARLEPVQRAVGHHAREVARDPEDHEDVGCFVGPARRVHRRIIPPDMPQVK